MLISALLPPSRMAMVVRLLVSLLGLTTAVGGILWWLAREQAARRNAHKRIAFERRFERFCLESEPKLAAAVKGLGFTDFDGRYCPHTPLGKSEPQLDKGLRQAGHLFTESGPHPIRPSIVPQYELLDLGWDRWTAAPSKRWRNYVADFAYFDPAFGIKIDIEIDEAYHTTAKQRLKDEKRDQTFLGRGWVVMRFPEASILRDAAGCSAAVTELAKALSTSNIRRLLQLANSDHPLPRLPMGRS